MARAQWETVDEETWCDLAAESAYALYDEGTDALLALDRLQQAGIPVDFVRREGNHCDFINLWTAAGLAFPHDIPVF